MRINGQVPSTDQILKIVKTISRAYKQIGFDCPVSALNRTSIKIGEGYSLFRVVVSSRGYNAYVGSHISSPKGYKRTNVPTWDQRVEFNNILNGILDAFNVVCNVKSGPFTVRVKEGALGESFWSGQATQNNMGPNGECMNGMGDIIRVTVTEKEAVALNLRKTFPSRLDKAVA